MEKYTPHYDLAGIKADVRRLGSKAFTRAAKESGEDLGFSVEDMQMSSTHYKTGRFTSRSLTAQTVDRR